MDNSRLRYYARGKNGQTVSQMPLTPFVYEFFLFNSLYQIDWLTSNDSSVDVSDPEEKSESGKQRRFINFLKHRLLEKPELLQRAFDPITDIADLDGPWTKIKAESRIKDAEGVKFFSQIRDLQDVLRKNSSPSGLAISKSSSALKSCVYYINNVRNNIFHGSKTLGDCADQDQKRRVEVYEIFLKGLTSLFFLAVGKSQAACDIVPCGIYLELRSSDGRRVEVTREEILKWTSRELLKVGDSRLIERFRRLAPAPKSLTDEKFALFYPSAGRDMLTPLFVALPYCTCFYFYEQGERAAGPPQIHVPLGKIASPVLGLGNLEWSDESGRRVLRCMIGGILRTIYWCHSDNTEFLEENVVLRFYFRRGDSCGEGGSGQKWDSDLLPKLLSKVPKDSTCLYLTDGFPGGFSAKQSLRSFELNLPFVERGRTYYCGELRPPSG